MLDLKVNNSIDFTSFFEFNQNTNTLFPHYLHADKYLIYSLLKVGWFYGCEYTLCDFNGKVFLDQIWTGVLRIGRRVLKVESG